MDKSRLEVVLLPSEEEQGFNLLLYVIKNIKLLAIMTAIGLAVGAVLGVFLSMRSNTPAPSKADIARYFVIDAAFLEEKTEERYDGIVNFAEAVNDDLNLLKYQMSSYRYALLRQDPERVLTNLDAIYTHLNAQIVSIADLSGRIPPVYDLPVSLLQGAPPEALMSVIAGNDLQIQAYREELASGTTQNNADIRVSLARMIAVNERLEAVLNGRELAEMYPERARRIQEDADIVSMQLNEAKKIFLDCYNSFTPKQGSVDTSPRISFMQVTKYIIVGGGGFLALGIVFALLRDFYKKNIGILKKGKNSTTGI